MTLGEESFPDRSWEHFVARHHHDLRHLARTVSAQSGVDDGHLYDLTLDIVARRWPDIQSTPVDDDGYAARFDSELAYARRVMGREFVRLDRRRRQRYRDQAADVSAIDRSAGMLERQWAQDPAFILARKEQANRIYTLIQELDEPARSVFIMRATLDMLPAEVAEVLEISRMNVNGLYFRTTKRLRRLAKDEGLG